MSRDVKNLLKEARNAIKNKDYKSSLRLCKLILKEDKENYMALVLCGVSLQENGQRDDALQAFRKAVKVDSKQILAWQGLASYYEKEDSPESRKELATIYEQLLDLESDQTKYSDLCNKLSNVAVQLQDPSHVSSILHKLATSDQNSEEKKRVAWLALGSLLTQINNLPDDLSPLFETTLVNILKEPSSVSTDYFKRYLKLLYKHKKYSVLITEAIRMYEMRKTDVYPLEWICKVFSEQAIQNDGFQCCNEVDKYIDSLLELNSESTMALLSKAVILFKEAKHMESRDIANKVVHLRPTLLYPWILLSECNLKLRCYSEVENSACQALRMLDSLPQKDDKLKLKLNLILLDAYSRGTEIEKLNQAINICNQIYKSEPDNEIVLSILARSHIALGNRDEAEKYLSELEAKDNSSFIILKAHALKKNGKSSEAMSLLLTVADTDSADVLIEIGKFYWQTKNYHESLTAFLKAAKVDPNCNESFVYLGHYYSENGDVEKARRCYQKAFKINPDCTEAGIGLSNIYREQKNWAANQQLLENVTSRGGAGNTRCKWAWLQMGLHHLDQGNAYEAINCLQWVIRADPNNSHCWESLADAYLMRGAYTSALKSYQRAKELCDDALYPALQSAHIKSILRLYTEARDEYLPILVKNPTYVPALKGLAETHLAIAKQYKQQQLLGCCRDNAQAAVDNATIAIKERSDLSCLWKIVADTFSLVANLPNKHCYLTILSALVSSETETKDERTTLDRQQLFVLSTRCYCRALNLSDNSVFIWHDLAANYLSHSKHCDGDQSYQLKQRSFDIAKHCVTTSPQRWQHWNLLGVIAMELNKYSLSQHSFIKATSLEKKNAVSWTNLGVLYLKLDSMKLANQAFTEAQRSDPEYVNSWIGQAIIAETLGHQDTMDLFRHSTQLAVHPQGGLGYAHWVCNTLISMGEKANELYEIRNMHAVTVATDALTWYNENIHNDACALNMLGLLLERQGLNMTAAKMFKQSLECVNDEHKDKVITNFARMLVKLGEQEEAINLYNQIKEASFVSECGLALANFKAKRYEESYGTYDRALNWLASTDTSKSHVLVAMAGMVYKFQSVEDAKTLLFQCIQLKPPSIHGLLAACAMGLIHADLQLSEFILKELQIFEDNKQYMSHIAILKSGMYCMQGDSELGVRTISKFIFKHPDQATLWMALAELLFRLEKAPSVAGKCALATVKQGRSTIDTSKVMGLVSLAELIDGNLDRAKRIAQKAIYSHPNIADGWTLLIASVLPECEDRREIKTIEWLRSVVGHVRRKTTVARPMALWLSNYERKITLMADQYKV